MDQFLLLSPSPKPRSTSMSNRKGFPSYLRIENLSIYTNPYADCMSFLPNVLRHNLFYQLDLQVSRLYSLQPCAYVLGNNQQETFMSQLF